MLAVTFDLCAILVFHVVAYNGMFVFPVLFCHKVVVVFHLKWYCSSSRA